MRRGAAELVADGAEAIAVCYLFSFLHPAHEQRSRELIEGRIRAWTCRCPARSIPRFANTTHCRHRVDAYMKPVVGRYLERLQDGLRAAQVRRRCRSCSRAADWPDSVARSVRCGCSCPDRGRCDRRRHRRASVGTSDLITIDVGGTSSDIALVEGGEPVIRAQGSIAGFPVRVPMVDVNAIGAGGGSIAWLDGAGGLRVGPHSAGSEPGPACYGRGGEEATVTDASVVLGWLDPAYFAGGSVTLDPSLARAAIEHRIAGRLACRSRMPHSASIAW